MRQGSQKIAKQKADGDVDDGIERSSRQIQPQKNVGAHFHAAGQRRSHGVDAGNELGEQQGGLTALVERFSRAQNAGLRVDRQLTQKAEQGPSHVAAQYKEQRVTQQHGGDGQQQQGGEVQEPGGCGGAAGYQGEGRRNGHSQGFGQDNAKHQKVSVASD